MPGAHRALIALLGACSVMGPIGTSLFLPALPSIADSFDVGTPAVQTIVSAYVLAFACGILLVGPLADRFGRRRIMLVGMSVFATGSLLAALAPSLPLLVVARIVQGAGAATGITVSRATVGDLFEGPALSRAIATLTLAMVSGTILAPFVGGHLAAQFGWRSGFWALAGMSALVAIACFARFPETRAHVRTPSHASELLKQGRSMLLQPAFFRYLVQGATIYAIFLVFIAVAPHVLVDALQRPATEFGLYYLFLAGGYFIGNFYVARIAHDANLQRVVSSGLWLQMVGVSFALGFVLLHLWHPLFVFGPMFALSIGQGLALPIITARAVALAPGYAGVASSLIGFGQQAIAAVAVQLMGWAPVDSPVPVIMFCTIAALVATLSKGRSRH